MDAAETDAPGVIMAVVEGAHEGETGSAVETPDHGMEAYCEAHEWVS